MTDVKSKSASPRRRWFRIGLRTLLVFMTLIAVLLAAIGKKIHKTRTQRAIVAELNAGGASVDYEGKFWDRPASALEGLRGKDFERADSTNWSEYRDDWLIYFGGVDAAYNVESVTATLPSEALAQAYKLSELKTLSVFLATNSSSDAIDHGWESVVTCQQIETLKVDRSYQLPRMVGLRKLPRLTKLVISHSDLELEEMEEIASIPNLKSLTLGLTGHTNEGLAHLAKATQLEELSIMHRGLSETVTDDGLAFVAKLTNLKKLELGRMPLITDEVFQHIEPLKKLEHLNLDQSSVTGQGLNRLKGLENLTVLNLVGTKTNDAAMMKLFAMKQLERLELQGTEVTDEGLVGIDKLSNLHTLGLYGTAITDSAMQEVVKLPNLKNLQLGKTEVTDEGLAMLSGHETLQLISVQESKITSAGRQRFSTDNPSCAIW